MRLWHVPAAVVGQRRNMQGNMLRAKGFDALAQARRVFGFTLLNKPPQRAQMKIALPLFSPRRRNSGATPVLQCQTERVSAT